MSDNDSHLTKADLEGLERRLKAYMDERTRQVQEYVDERTLMLKHAFCVRSAITRNRQSTRYRHIKADLGNLNTSTDERLDALETRITNIDKRLIAKGI